MPRRAAGVSGAPWTSRLRDGLFVAPSGRPGRLAGANRRRWDDGAPVSTALSGEAGRDGGGRPQPEWDGMGCGGRMGCRIRREVVSREVETKVVAARMFQS